ncbi:MAG: hypothetical protein ABSF69_15960 [Polyangiaceae bacterium]|jgi:hypothetical protein
MRRTNKWLWGGFVAAALLTVSARSRAQDAATTKGDTGGQGDYGYKFEDDPLSAGGFGPADATIRVRPGPVRTTLIRPRTSFVPEMLKSVENI